MDLQLNAASILALNNKRTAHPLPPLTSPPVGSDVDATVALFVSDLAAAGAGGTPERFYDDLDAQTQGILTSSELGPGLSPDADNSQVAFALGQFVAYSIYVANAINNGFQANLENFRSWFLSNQG